MKKIFYLVLLCSIISCSATIEVKPMNDPDNFLQSLVDKSKTPSVSYIHFNKDSILHTFSSGYADVHKKKLSSEKTTYSGFSVTKTLTAVAIMQLAEKGKLSIDDEAAKYIANFPYPSDITIRQLLTHTAGIPNPLPIKWVHLPGENHSFNRNLFFDGIFAENSKVKSAPNEKFAYSNIGYFILGQIIENVTQMSYEDYIFENINKPLGISKEDLGFSISKEESHSKGYQKKFSFMNLALGFMMDKSTYVDKTEGKWISFKDMIVNGTSHGGLIASPQALATYLQELLKTDCILLSEEYKELLFVENLTGSNEKTGMCLSWFKGQLGTHTYYSHAGGGAGYYCEIRIYPEEGIGSVIMFNHTGVKDERILDTIDNYFFE